MAQLVHICDRQHMRCYPHLKGAPQELKLDKMA